MKGKLAIILLITACVVWMCVRQSQVCTVCTVGVPNLESVLLPPTPAPLSYAPPPSADEWRQKGAGERLANVRARLLPKLPHELMARGVEVGAPAYLRAFKESRELELWLRSQRGEWLLYRTYPIFALSGELGPKLREGDGQTPEGVYSVTKQSLNPLSLYHLSFNIGYPNDYDRAHQRTGSAIMVHGSNVSIGCLAMSDAGIEEIYLLVAEALEHGQTSVPVHIFPFRMTAERMAQAAAAAHFAFWSNLKGIHDRFENTRKLPKVAVTEGLYEMLEGNL